MGIDNIAARALLLAKFTEGVSFENTITLGRHRNYMGPLLQRSVEKNLKLPSHSLQENYADSFFRYLGASKLFTLDFSSYENADLIHNLNLPLNTDQLEGYTLVVDAGTSEHIFNLPQALQNIRDLCEVGGHALMISPANGWLGHGFYQFSPELLFRSFDSSNGFNIEFAYLSKTNLFGTYWYKLTDPRELGERGTIATNKKCSLIFLAKKISSNQISTIPNISDYEIAWEGSKISKLGAIYISLPINLRQIVARVIISPLNKIRHRRNLKYVRFAWVHTAYREKSRSQRC